MVWSAERFEHDFPGLKNVMIRYTEHGRGVVRLGFDNSGGRCHGVRELCPDICCNDPDCRGGGHKFYEEIQQMLMRGEDARSGQHKCPGTRGTPQLRKVYGICFNGGYTVDNVVMVLC